MVIAGIVVFSAIGIVPTLVRAPEPIPVTEQLVGVEVRVLEIEGLWRVTISDSGTATIDASTEDSREADRLVDYDDGTLRLRSRVLTGRGTAAIPAPELNRLEIDGAADVRIEGLVLPALIIEIDGTGDVTGVDTSVERLEISTDGAARIDFSAAQVVNATLDVDGAASIDLAMSGGELIGEIDGAGQVNYTGTVSREAIDIDGLGRVEGPR